MRRTHSRTPALPPGKLLPEVLNRLLSRLKVRTADVLVGPGVGLDAAVIRTRGRWLAVTSDPITLAADLMAYYCVHVNANDLAVMGATPRFMVVVCLLPVGSGSIIQRLGRDLARYVATMGIAVVGGHSEVTPAVNSPVMVGTMFGPLIGRRPLGAAGARPGDVVVMTKHAALEATAIIAREQAAALAKHGLSTAQVRRAQRLLFVPGISIVPEAKIALAAGCSAMHDATEGGIVTALWEIAKAANVRIRLDVPAIPILPLTARICRPWHIDPLRAISSGSLLLTIPKRKLDVLTTALTASSIKATAVAEVTEGPPVLEDRASGTHLAHAQDEILKLRQ